MKLILTLATFSWISAVSAFANCPALDSEGGSARKPSAAIPPVQKIVLPESTDSAAISPTGVLATFSDRTVSVGNVGHTINAPNWANPWLHRLFWTRGGLLLARSHNLPAMVIDPSLEPKSQVIAQDSRFLDYHAGSDLFVFLGGAGEQIRLFSGLRSVETRVANSNGVRQAVLIGGADRLTLLSLEEKKVNAFATQTDWYARNVTIGRRGEPAIRSTNVPREILVYTNPAMRTSPNGDWGIVFENGPELTLLDSALAGRKLYLQTDGDLLEAAVGRDGVAAAVTGSQENARGRQSLALEIFGSNSTGRPSGAPIRFKKGPGASSTALPSVLFLEFSPDGKKLVLACDDGAVYAANVRTLDFKKIARREAPVSNLSFSADGKTLQAAWETGTGSNRRGREALYVWNTSDLP